MWKNPSLSYLDPHASICEQEVQKIIHLQKITNQMSDAFTDLKRITKSHILAENVSIQIDVSKGPSTSVIANESKARLKRGRPLGSKDRNPRKRKTNGQDNTTKDPYMEVQDLSNVDISEGINMPETQENEELSINSSDVETNLN